MLLLFTGRKEEDTRDRLHNSTCLYLPYRYQCIRDKNFGKQFQRMHSHIAENCRVQMESKDFRGKLLTY